jgi:hypothetical protein
MNEFVFNREEFLCWNWDVLITPEKKPSPMRTAGLIFATRIFWISPKWEATARITRRSAFLREARIMNIRRFRLVLHHGQRPHRFLDGRAVPV